MIGRVRDKVAPVTPMRQAAETKGDFFMAKVQLSSRVVIPRIYCVRLEDDWAYIGSNVVKGDVPAAVALDFLHGCASVEAVISVVYENERQLARDRDYLRSFEDDEDAYDTMEAACEEQRLQDLIEYYKS